jgi:chorismate mutase
MTMPAFERRVSKETIGCPKPFNACADPVICNGMGLYLQVAKEVVTEACWWCAECSHAERATLEIACHLVHGRTLDSVHQLGVEAFVAAGGNAVNDLPMTCVRVLLAVEMALVDHEVKHVLATAAEQDIDANQKLKQLGFVARDGQQRLKKLLEGELVRFHLQVPIVKTQEWTAIGTLEDCSRWVQSALKTALLNEVMERCYPSA